MLCIDLNCDMGEGIGNDGLIMPYISSANIACGYHAGNETTMHQTVLLALRHNVAIGAHPGFDDKENFGRLEMPLSINEVYTLVTTQVLAIKSICAHYNAMLHHVKPHGALYNMAAKDKTLAGAIAGAVKDIDAGLILYGLSNSYLVYEAQSIGLQTANEVFADRRYSADGSLIPRSLPGALIKNQQDAIAQVLQMVLNKFVTVPGGKQVPVNAQTICLHGDGENAASFAQSINAVLGQNGIFIKPPLKLA